MNPLTKNPEGQAQPLGDLTESLLESIPQGAFLLDGKGRYIVFNQAFSRIAAMDEPRPGRRAGTSLQLAEQRAAAREFLAALRGAETRLVVHAAGGDRGRRAIEIKLRPVSQAGSRLVLGTASPVAGNKAENEIDRRRMYLEAVLRDAPDAIVTLDPQHRIIEWNPAAEAIFGYTRDEAVGRDPDGLIARGEVSAEAKAITRRVLQGREFPPTETVRYRKDGTPVNVTVSGSPIYTGDRLSGIVALYRDITEQKRLELQLQQAQKLEAVGTLAGGIAHDFNNLLMGIQGRASLMLMDTSASHPHFEHLKSIEEYSRSATELTKQLLGFARGGPVETRPTALNELILKITGMFGRTRKEIRIHTELSEGLDMVEVDPGQIEQVLLNLLVNAWQAMTDGGSVFVSTGAAELGELKAKSLSVNPGRYVWVSVRDTGPGMDRGTMKRIFDPFFTTKKRRGGNGFGLTSAYGIVKRHGGAIEVRSGKGKGSEFILYIPPATGGVESAHSGREHPLCRGTETVLLVDDEEMVIEVGAELLRKLGYTVLVARSGLDAVKIYREQGDSIGLVVLDMVMPDMNGKTTYEALSAIDPGVRVLLSSGYSANGAAQEILNKGQSGFIQKPFNIHELSVKLREVLDHTPRKDRPQ